MKIPKKAMSFELKVPIYDITLYFEFGKISDLGKTLKRMGCSNWNDEFTQAGLTLNLNEYESSGILIAIDEFWEYKPSFGISVLSHELIHVSNMIIERYGLECDLDNDEVLAYLQSYILETVLERVGKYIFK